jgi:vitamin B12 transporter
MRKEWNYGCLFFLSALKVNANYTFTQVEEPLSRLIPKHKGNISLDYQTPRSFFY